MATCKIPALGVLLLSTLTAVNPCAAEEPEEPGAASRACRFCPDYSGLSGFLDLGLGYQDEDSYRFGRYTGLQDEGAFVNGGGQVEYRGEEGDYFDARARNLGLDSRDMRIEGGQQGRYELYLEYDQLPNLGNDTTSSPFHGRSGNQLSLPPDWVPASSTEDMTALPQTLNDVSIKSERRKLGTGFSFIPRVGWEITGRASHEKKEGRRDLGATFLFNQTSILPAPFEYETNEVGLALGYTGKELQAEFAYDGSFFKDNNKGLVWQNPFVDRSSPTGEGQLAQPPDNQYHKLSATLGYDLLKHTRVNGHVAVGRMIQNEDFLPYTVNPDIAVSALPANDLDGKVNTTLAKLDLSSRPMPKLRLNANYTFSDRDNDSDQNDYEYVVTDSFLAPAARENLTYSFKQHLLRVSAGYKLPKRTDLSVGFDYDRVTRTNQEVKNTQDRTAWTRFKARPHEMVDASIKYSYSDRDASNYREVDDDLPPQNPLMRVYNLASRKQNKIGTTIAVMPTEALNLGLSADYYKDDYDDTSLGLEETKGTTFTVDLSYLLTEDIVTNAYYTREQLKSEQSGSQTFSEPDWFLNDKNVTNTVGAGIEWTAIPEKLDLGAEIVHSRYRGDIDLEDAEDYPDLESKLTSLRLRGTYRLKSNLSLDLTYLYEKYNEDDWAIDGIGVASVPTVLSLGAEDQDYDVNVVMASVRYRFE